MNKFRWFTSAVCLLVLSVVVVYWFVLDRPIEEPEALPQFPSTTPSSMPNESDSKVLTPAENITALINAFADAANDDERERLLRELAELSPSAAIQQAQRATGERGFRLSLAVLEVWSHNDFSAAWQWSENAGENLFAFRKVLLASVAESDRELALQLARKWSASQPAQAADIAAMVVDALAGAGNYSPAIQFAQTTSLDVDERESLLRDIANTWTIASPTEAAEWALAQKAELYDVVLPAVVDSWLNTDPFYAVEFVNSLPESTSRRELIQEAVSRWLAIDQSGATHWLMAAGQRPEFDRAILGYATADDVIRNNPDMALLWARRITDSPIKIAALNQILTDLKLSSHPQANAYLQNANELQDEDREKLRQITAAEP